MAPAMSQFTTATVPDMSNHCDQSAHWVSNFILSTLLRSNVPSPTRQYMFNFLRRAEASFLQHSLAREATATFLSGSRQSPSRYMTAIFHWEVFLSQAWRSYNLLKYLFDIQKVFQKGDGSIEERLNLLYNQSKHAESVIKSQNIPFDATIPMWLTNNGLKSNDAYLSYAESGEVLADIAKWAQLIQDPASMREKIERGDV